MPAGGEVVTTVQRVDLGPHASLSDWVAATPAREGLIRLVLLDVDGCLTDGEASRLDIPALQLIAALNQRALEEPDLPAITLCTGRQAPYVELLCQAIGTFVPAIWETGAGLFDPIGYRFLRHPLMSDERLAAFEAIKGLIWERVEAPGLARRQPGKDLSLSLYPTTGTSVDQLYEAVAGLVEPFGEHYGVHRLLSCVEATPRGIDKGAGARWLCELTGLRLENMVGIGDQTPDLSYLSIVAAAAVPANATPDLRAMADYVAPRRSSQGVLDILNWVVARNRAT
ncbi:MAG: HAD hydrolase family protein [Chloroflexota bacterium]